MFPILENYFIFEKFFYICCCNHLLKREFMKKRSLLAIFMVAIGLFISTNLFSDEGSSASSNQNQEVTGHDINGNTTADTNGVYIPD